MNNFKTYAGTQPIYLGDIDFMQDAEKAMLTALARSLANSSSDTVKAILQGVELTQQSSDELRISAGIVVLNGEILLVPDQIISASASDTLYFHVESTMSGSRTFMDGVRRDCYEARRAIVNTTSSGGIRVSSVPRLYHRPNDFDCASQGSDSIVSGKLYRRNGFWFLDLYFEFAPQTTTISGSITFTEGITVDIFNDIKVLTYIPAIINVRYSNTYAMAMLAISMNAADRSVTITINNATAIPSSENTEHGDMNVMLIPA